MKKATKKSQKTESLEWFIPALCLMIIFSALLIKPGKALVFPPSFLLAEPAKQALVTSAPLIEAFLGFVPPEIAVKKDEEVSVELRLTPKKELSLDGVDIVLAFDPKAVAVTRVVPEKLFSFSTLRAGDLTKGRIAVTFLEEKKDGIVLKDPSTLLTIFLKAKESGSSEISVVLTEKGPSTVITQTKTSQKIQFESQKLVMTLQ